LNGLLLALGLVLLGAVLVVAPAEGGPAVLITVPLIAVVAVAISRLEDRKFLLRVFIAGLLVRVALGTVIYVFHWQTFFGGDAITYDFLGDSLVNVWHGNVEYQRAIDIFYAGGSSSGWGMMYYVAGIYQIVGRNMLAIQFVNCALGAATAPLAYLMATEIFPSKPVARSVAILTAFFPSLLIWSCQGLKDGPIVFLLALSMLAVLRLGNRFSVRYLTALAAALCCLLTLRFYIFYIVALAGGAAFILGRRRLTAQSFVRQLIVISLVSLALAYFGVSRYATQQLEAYGNADQIQRMRLDASRSAESGFGKDIDVSTTSGAMSAIPIGFTYLLLAPFPWQFGSLRQMLTLPEMIVWWLAIPLLVLGLWFTLKHRIREIAPIMIFTSLLTLTYSIVQGNVGTAYRQRAQLLVFYFLFVGVGFVLVKERRAAQRHKKELEQEAVARRRQRPKPGNDQIPAVG